MKYDPYGMLVSSRDTVGHTTNNVYNADHTLKSMTDAKGQTTSYTYDGKGNRTSQTLPRTITSINTTSQTVYDPQFSLPTQTIDELGNKRNFSYDANFWPKIAT